MSRLDYWFAKQFHQFYAWGGEIANKFMECISHIAEAGILFLVVGLGLALFKKTRKIGGTVLFAVALGFLFTNIILKNAIGRARPFENISSDYYLWWLDAGASFESGHSFPSGHTTATTCFAVALFLATNKNYSWPILFLPLAMACSRIYLMVHFFSDCLAGIIVGSACAIISYFVLKLIYKSNVKFFVWLREFDVFKPSEPIKYPEVKKGDKSITDKSSSTTPSKADTDLSKNEPKEEYIYLTEAEEKAKIDQQKEAEEPKTEETKE